MIKHDRFFAAFDELVIELVEYFQHGHVWRELIDRVFDEASSIVRTLLTPHVQVELHW